MPTSSTARPTWVDPSGLSGGNPITNYFGGIGRNGSFAWNWFWQTGHFPNATTQVLTINGHTHDVQVYGPDAPQTQDLINSPGMAWVQLVYFANGCQIDPHKDITSQQRLDIFLQLKIHRAPLFRSGRSAQP